MLVIDRLLVLKGLFRDWVEWVFCLVVLGILGLIRGMMLWRVLVVGRLVLE